ncbi:MAG: DUF3465 domain-containing protein [Eubacteriaceae bacterium]|jgi:hypothetical protein|nr:DUF3465 domain-containing protein [Eubacteriaceae bacterium]
MSKNRKTPKQGSAFLSFAFKAALLMSLLAFGLSSCLDIEGAFAQFAEGLEEALLQGGAPAGIEEVAANPVQGAPPADAGGEGGSQAGESPPADSDSLIKELFLAKAQDAAVEGRGAVLRTLADDSDGSRHQKFILKLENGMTLLVAHNIDIAPRLEGLKAGDEIEFAGEYVYSEQGGTVHWTHRDPNGAKKGGWLKWKGHIYQ